MTKPFYGRIIPDRPKQLVHPERCDCGKLFFEIPLDEELNVPADGNQTIFEWRCEVCARHLTVSDERVVQECVGLCNDINCPGCLRAAESRANARVKYTREAA